MKPKVTLTIHTASFDNFLENQGINSYFQALTYCLLFQKLKSFELVYIDTFYEDNKDKFAGIIADLPFQVKHVPIHPNHRYWYDLGHTYIAAAKNTGMIYADGELVVTCDDAEFFPEDFLASYWDCYEKGVTLIASHKRMTSIKTADGCLCMPIEGDIYVNDHRVLNLKDDSASCDGSWTYAGTSYALSDGLKVNGFNERMDGCKSLEDCEFGYRLKQLGRKLMLQKCSFMYILDHKSYVDEQRKKIIRDFIAVENYGTLRCTLELFEVEANKTPLTDKHYQIIKRETLKYRNFDPLADENAENLKKWAGVPVFNLKKEREEIRQSSEWKWQ